MSTLAGSGASGMVDGVGSAAAFDVVRNLALMGASTLFDSDATALRAIDLATGGVSTLSAGGLAAITAPTASENLTLVYNSFLVYDAGTCALLLTDASSGATTVAAGGAGGGYANGMGSAARFSCAPSANATNVTDMALMSGVQRGKILILDAGNNAVRLATIALTC